MSGKSEDLIDNLERGFEIHGWRVCPTANSLTRPGSPEAVQINSKAMQVLVLLAANAGAFVSKDKFLATVWASRVVTEDVLTGAIRTVRRALGDDARNPRFIETRKGAGYRLIAEVEMPGSRRAIRFRYGWRLAAAILFAVTLPLSFMAVRLFDPAAPATIAVLPFDTISSAERDKYLASAITDALILNLAERDKLRIISRTSVLPYTGQGKSLQSIAQELKADYLVEGSVITDANHMRVSAQLVDGRSDTHLWAAKYDRKIEDVFLLQTDVANQIARQVIGAVTDTPSTAPPALTGPDLDTLLKARYLLQQEKSGAVRQALELFAALAKAHPDAAVAHLGLAQAQLQLFKAYEMQVEVLEQAEASALRAIELDPRSPEALRCLGQIVQFRDWDFRGAESLFQRAIELNASDTVTRRRYAWLLVALQRYDDAMEQINYLRMLDPHYYASADGALLLLFAGQHASAIAELERVNRARPGSARTLRILSTAYWAVGRYDESAATLIESRIAAGNSAEELRAAFAADGRAGVYRYLLANEAFRAPVAQAALYAQLGDVDAALGRLEQAVTERDPNLIFALDRPELVGLHDHPRFRAVMNRVARID